MVNDNTIAKKIKLISEVQDQGNGLLDKLGNCYGQLAEAILGSTGLGIVKDNNTSYRYLLNKDIIAYMTYAYASGLLKDCENRYSNLGKILSVGSENYITKHLSSLGVSTIAEFEVNDLLNAVNTFGISETTELDDIEQEEAPDSLVESLEKTGVFGSLDDLTLDDEPTDLDLGEADDGDEPVDLDDESVVSDEPSQPGPEVSAETDDFDEVIDLDDDTTGETPKETPVNPEDNAGNKDGDEPEENKDDYSDLKAVWGTQLRPIIKSIMTAYSDLYAAGYALVPPVGVLTNQGIICAKSNKTGVSVTGDAVTDIKMYNKIKELTGDQYLYFAQHGEDFDVNKLLNMRQPLTLTDMHIRNMFGYFSFCTHKYSLRRYISKHNINNKSETKMIRYEDMRGYIQENLEDMFYSSYRLLGITSQISEQAIDLVDNINSTLCRSLKNVIIVVERKPNVNTRVKICSDKELNINSIIEELNKGFNIGTSNAVQVKLMTQPSNGVYDINIIYNMESYSQDALFAYQVLDILEDQNIRPSWNNVILGKKDDGTIMTYNFKNYENPFYALYAGSRSGKGVMTLNLLASAMADGCKIMYIDAKPEMSAVLADLAWKSGLDTFAFNGYNAADNYTLEGRGNCIRKVDQFSSRTQIPDNIFIKKEQMDSFIMVVQFYKAIEALILMAKNRFEKCKSDDWIVAVIDECEQFAAQEAKINNVLSDAYTKRKNAIDPTDPKGRRKINITRDPAAIFIDNYRAWIEGLKADFNSCVNSVFGKGNITTIFVWQSSKLTSEFEGKAAIADMIIGARGKMIKIVGKGGVVQGGSTDFGNATTLKSMPWYDERFSGETGGFFAIGSNLTGNMKVFRPFNVYSNADRKDLIVLKAQAAGLCEEDLIGVSLNPDGTVIPEVGFEGYVTRLLSRFNISPAKQLNIGFEYADNFIRESGRGNGLLEFVYNAHTFDEGTHSNESSLEGNQGFNVGNGGFNVGGQGDNTPDIDTDSGEDIDFGDPQPTAQSQHTGDNPESRRASPRDTILTPNDGYYDNPQDRFDAYNGYSPDDGQEYDEQGYDDYEQDYDPGYGGNPTGDDADFWDNGSGSDRFSEQSEEIEDDDLDYPPYRHRQTRDVSPHPEEVRNMGAQSYRYGSGSDRNITFFTSSKSANILKLNRENSCVVTVRDHRSIKQSNKLFKFFAGTNYELKSRWESILAAVARNQSPDSISKVTIFNDALVFNRRQIAAIGLIGGMDGVEVRDIVNFKALGKKFRNIRELQIDYDIYEASYNELGDYPETSLFSVLPRLNKLAIWNPGSNDKPNVYTRQSINSSRAEQEMMLRNERTKLKRGMDAIAASKNPNFSKLGSIEKNRILNGSKRLTGAGWEACKHSFSNDHYFRGTLAGAFTIASGVATLGVMSVLKLGSLFNRGR